MDCGFCGCTPCSPQLSCGGCLSSWSNGCSCANGDCTSCYSTDGSGSSCTCGPEDLNCGACYSSPGISCSCTRGDYVCNACVPGASLNTGTNACDCATSVSADSNYCCHSTCSDCSSENFYSCIDCSDNNPSIYSLCLGGCPSGYSADGNNDCGISDIHLVSDSFNNEINPTIGSVTYTTFTNMMSTYTSNGPYPLEHRGFYFTGSGSGTSSGTVALSPKSSFHAWVKATTGAGDVFEIPSGVKTGFTSGQPFVNSAHGGSVTATGSTSYTNTWVVLGFNIVISGTAYTTVEVFIDGTSQTSATSGTNAISLVTGNYVIGGTFVGFIWSLDFYNSNGNHNSYTASPSCLTGDTLTCPGSCAHAQYTADDGSCVACDAACDTCVRDDFRCNLCKDQLCSTCTDFTMDCVTCITNAVLVDSVCECDVYYYFEYDTELCELCDTHCRRCTGPEYDMCYECDSPKVLYLTLCQDFCPDGYTVNGSGVCVVGDTHIFNLEPRDISVVYTDSQQGIAVHSGDDHIIYPGATAVDVVPAKERGLYFQGTSYMMLPPNDFYIDPLLVMGTPLTIAMWVNPASGTGTLFNKYDPASSSTSSHLRLKIASQVPSTEALLENGTSPAPSFSTLSVSLNAWSLLVFKLYISSSDLVYEMYVNTNTESQSGLQASWFVDVDSDFEIVLGAAQSSYSTYTDFYTGFLWDLQIHVADVAASSFLGTCGSCTNCPTTNACIPNCLITEFVESNGSCTACQAQCTEGCVRDDLSCNLCNDIRCHSCHDWDTVCNGCKDNAELDGADECQCSTHYFWDTTTEQCTACSPYCLTCSGTLDNQCLTCDDSRFLTDEFCLPTCPKGFTQSGSTCVVSQAHILFFEFSDIQGTLTDSVNSYQGIVGQATTFYPNYDSLDPYPTKERGYYFNGNSIVQLPPNSVDGSSTIIFNVNLVLAFWLSPIDGDGILFAKQNSAGYGSAIEANLISFQPQLRLLGQYSKTESQLEHTCGITLTTNTWTFLMFSLYMTNEQMSIACKSVTTAGGAPSTSDDVIGEYFFEDLDTNFLLTLGAGLHATGVSSGFTGFMYTFSIYNGNEDAYAAEVTTTCSGCSACPAHSALCSPNCLISEYFESSSCQTCHANCALVGCVRADETCNLCADQQCYECSDFTTCNSSCVENASGTPCDCDTDAVFLNSECTACPTGCDSCDGILFNECTSCSSGYYSAFHMCLDACPSGYTASSVLGTCQASNNALVVDLILDSIAGIATDSTGHQFVTGTSSVFYPDYEDDDPIAAFERGYYFTGSSVMHGAVYTDNLSPLFTFAPDITLIAWVFPEAYGVIYSKQHGTTLDAMVEMKLTSTGIDVALVLEVFGSATTSCTVSYNLNEWTQLGVSVALGSDGNTVVTCYVYNTASTPVTVGFGYFQDTDLSARQTLGAHYVSWALADYFTGFLYSLHIYNTAVVPTHSTSCTGTCAKCPSADCLSDCLIGEYYDTDTSACESCHANCASVGCLSSGPSCSLCSSYICRTCTDYTAACTECVENASTIANCECDAGYYWDITTEVCEPCNPTCLTCTGSTFANCVDCHPNYLRLNEVCTLFCPTGFSDVAGECTESTSPAFQLLFDSLMGVIEDSQSSIPVLTGTTDLFYPDLDPEDPYPVFERGFYFTGSSHLQLPPHDYANVPKFLLSNEFTVSVWINQVTGGTLLAKQNTDRDPLVEISTASTTVSFVMYLTNHGENTFTCSQTLASDWNHLVVSVHLNGGVATFDCAVNNNAGTQGTVDLAFYKETDSEFTFLIGAEKTATGFTGHWTGYMHDLRIYNSYYTTTIPATVCTGTCSLCPVDTCLSLCTYSQFEGDSGCEACEGACSVCMSADPTCNLCADPICRVCDDYTSDCSECKSNASFGTECQCDAGYFWYEDFQVCSECHPYCTQCASASLFNCLECFDPYVFLSNICYPSCPTGYTDNAGNCELNDGVLLDISFDEITGYFAEASSYTIQVRAGESTQFYPDYDSTDPKAVFARGYYFTGSSVVHLPPTDDDSGTPNMLGPSFTLYAWVRPEADGTIFTKQLNAASISNYLFFGVDNDRLTAEMFLSTESQESAQYSTVLTYNEWQQVVLLVIDNPLVNTEVKLFINANEVFATTFADAYFYDTAEGYFMTIGAAYSSTGDLTRFFTGYIYSLGLLNFAELDPLNLDATSSCTSNPDACTLCPASGDCLPSCGLTEYYDSGTCGPCAFYCEDQCLDADLCTLCKDTKCHTCADFGDGCEQCKTNASLSVTCECDATYHWHLRLEQCMDCVDRCAECSADTHYQCSSCDNSYYMCEGVCLDQFCPTGYVQSTGTCTDGSGPLMVLDLAGRIEGLITVDGFEVQTGSTTEFYPDYDADDPEAAHQRGYYFTGSSYLSVLDSKPLILAPRFIVEAWLNSASWGPLIEKKSDDGLVYFAVDLASNAVTVLLTLLQPSTFIPGTTASQLDLTVSMPTSTWVYFALQINVEATGEASASVYLDGALVDSVNSLQSFFEDKTTAFSVLIGADTSGFYTGFLKMLAISQGTTFLNSFSDGCGGCTGCLADDSCIPDCVLGEFFDGSACDSCSGCDFCESTDHCNLCEDIRCYKCTAYVGACETCITNADFVGADCQCTNALWNEETKQCDSCYIGCTSCTSTSSTRCSACKAEYLEIDSICVTICPTGYTQSGSTCTVSTTTAFTANFNVIEGSFEHNGVELIAGSSTNYYPGYDTEDPYAIEGRGYYFSGDASMSFSELASAHLVYHFNFAIGAWVNPSSLTGTIVSKSADSVGLLAVSLDTDLTLTLLLVDGVEYSSTCSGLSANSWQFIGFSVSITSYNSVVTCYINTAGSPDTLTESHFQDVDSSYVHVIGTDYTGFIYSFVVYNSASTFSSEISGSCSGCSYCPPAGCLSTCTYLQIEGACTACDARCTTGCVRETDCRLCADTFCEICEDYSTCATCTTNANDSGGSCQCTADQFLDETAFIYRCCFPDCDQCSGTKNGDCDNCAAGTYRQPEGLCLASCPMGYEASGTECSAVYPDILYVHYKFNETSNTQWDRANDYRLFMGSDDSYVGPNDPYPIYGMGQYFDGNAYIQLPPNSVDANDIIFGNTHTVSMWVRPQQTGSDQFLMQKASGASEILSLKLDDSRVISVNFELQSTVTPGTSTYSLTATALDQWDHWKEVGYSVAFTADILQVKLNVNGIVQTGNAYSLALLDNSDSFVLGTDFQGFIFEFKVYNYELTFTEPPTVCACLACTAENDCLQSCSYLQYYNMQCRDCDAGCTQGCLRNGDCRKNLDELCESGTTYLAADCEVCIDLAELTVDGCQCIDYASYNDATGACECEVSYNAVEDNCTPHYYHIQDSDVVRAEFTADYYSIEFEFSTAVQVTTTSECVLLFSDSSYAKLGSRPKCSWNNDMTILTLKLGTNADVLEETVTFRSGALFTSQEIASSNESDVDASVVMVHDTSTFVPTAVVEGPSQLYAKCNDLALDGTSSSGGHNRELEYQWTFTTITTQYETYSDASQISLEGSQFVRSSTVTLTVRNWLGNTDSATLTFEVNTEYYEIAYDTSVSLTMKSNQSKNLFMQVNTKCTAYPITYTWSSPDVDEEFWNTQQTDSKLVIQKQQLTPGSYSFTLAVEDEQQNTGTTSFTIEVLSSALVAKSSIERATWNIQKTYRIYGDSSYDPDQLEGTISYSWSCTVNQVSCNDLFNNLGTSELEALQNTLEADKTYVFTMTISKDSRTASKTITVTTVNYQVPEVEFSDLEAPVFTNYPLVVTADFSDSQGYTFEWTVTSSGSYSLISSTDGTDLVFREGSLDPGTLYELTLTATSDDGQASYSVSFTTPDLPTVSSFTLTPSSGTEHSTLFELAADSNGSAYQFGYYLDGKVRLLNVKNETATLFTKFPFSSSPLTVFVRSFNEYGEYTEAQTTVSVQKNNEEYLSELAASLEAKLDTVNSNELPIEINIICAALLEQEAEEDTYLLTKTALDALDSSIYEYEQSDILTVMQLYEACTESSGFTNTIGQSALISELGDLVDEIKTGNMLVDNSLAGLYTEALANVYSVSPTSIETDATSVNSMNQRTLDLLEIARESMGTGQTLQIETSQVTGYAQILEGDAISSFVSDAYSAGTVVVPDDPSLNLDKYETVMAVVLSYYSEGADSGTAAMEFSLFGPNSKLEFSLSDNYFNITIPTYTVNSDIDCVYLADDSWSTEGCILETVTVDSVLCRCNHLSVFSFVPASESSSGGSSNSSGAELYVYILSAVGAVLLIVGIIVCILFRRRYQGPTIATPIKHTSITPLDKTVVEDDRAMKIIDILAEQQSRAGTAK